jgi:hypothetical protein
LQQGRGSEESVHSKNERRRPTFSTQKRMIHRPVSGTIWCRSSCYFFLRQHLPPGRRHEALRPLAIRHDPVSSSGDEGQLPPDVPSSGGRRGYDKQTGHSQLSDPGVGSTAMAVLDEALAIYEGCDPAEN